ncbi:putative leucine-rich repeat domain superfamily [Helianthus annuus]|uniref:Leucine-rich repeat domain superfamily n=1 Tax=Helianthus annuus TaxID=4232 RepID=A0A9K3EGJ4_HELAN|nr:putative leucine-rich repeat domain superfamily [Helianthus annuus]KAJ0847791.1 putative leucine-rich repeat domain superfamily [Helianthus annuus]
MEISYCPSLDDSFPCGLWPPNLRWLEIGGLKKDISEPASLVTLILNGRNSDRVVSFGAEAEDISSFLLPSSLTRLHLLFFTVSEGLQHLTSLQHLGIWLCPKLRDLPETQLPSLLSLAVIECSPELRKKCSPGRRKGKYWSIISQIPRLTVRKTV